MFDKNKLESSQSYDAIIESLESEEKEYICPYCLQSLVEEEGQMCNQCLMEEQR